MASKTAPQATISLSDLEIINMDEALAICHCGETVFRRDVWPYIDKLKYGCFVKQQVIDWMLDHVEIRRVPYQRR